MDRNKNFKSEVRDWFKSLSARRAWIEMWMALFPAPATMVALRKESVDRNAEDWLNAGSLSVALRKESVDRNDTETSALVP